jgi:hypothetical protein
MTAPTGAKSVASAPGTVVPGLPPAPNGYLFNGAAADTTDQCRDDMLNTYLQMTSDLQGNTDYYIADARPASVGISVPPEMANLLAAVGYPRVYVDSISERLELEGFRLADIADNTALNGTTADPGIADPGIQDTLWDWWEANNLSVEAPLGNTSALVDGRAYITISAPDPAVDLFVDPTVPIIRVETAATLYAQIDPRTRTVLQAIRRIVGAPGTPQDGLVIGATLYLPMQTIAWISLNGEWTITQQVPHNLGVVPVVPITNRTLLSDLTGTSQITPELRSITDAAARILMDMQGAAELMGMPQRLLFGVRPQDIGVDPATGTSTYNAYMARILAFEEEGGKAFQFDAAELYNFVNALDALDKKAAAYTGLPPQYLSYSSANPASADAIRAAEARLVKLCERKCTVFGGAWEQAMRIAYAVMNGGMQSLPPNFYRMEAVWRDPSTPTFAAQADAAVKAYGNGAGVIPKERARIDMGYSPIEREQMMVWDQQEMAGLLGAYTQGPVAVVPAPPAAGDATPPSPGAGAAAAIGGAQDKAAAAATAAKPAATSTKTPSAKPVSTTPPQATKQP